MFNIVIRPLNSVGGYELGYVVDARRPYKNSAGIEVGWGIIHTVVRSWTQ